MRIWIDTDVGSDVDDALTLAYVLRHPELELVGISTVFGDVELRTEIAEALLTSANVGGIPILTGLGTPLTEGRDGLMFGHEGEGILEARTPQMRRQSDQNADKRVADLATALAGAQPDVLLAIGPLSNLGALVRTGIRLPPLAIMGGKIADVLLKGMIAGIDEWNWYCDPLATQLVIGADHLSLPRIVPAEVTFQTALAKGDVERLGTGDSLSRQLSILCERWLQFLKEKTGNKDPRIALHDPLTAAILVNDQLCRFERFRILINERAAAKTVGGEPNVLVAIDVDAEALRNHLMDIWL